MRSQPTPAEDRLARLLRTLLPNPGSVEQQWAFGVGPDRRYILDFYIPEVRLGLEVDGAQHQTRVQRQRDKEKESAALEAGITIRRISNRRCLKASDEELTEWLRGLWREASRARRKG